MRLSRSSLQATGGRTVPHVDGVAIPAFVGRVAGSAVGCWYGDRALNQTTVEGKLKLVADDGEIVSEEGQNHLFGNDEMWAADLDGYRDSTDLKRPDWVPVALDDTSNRVAVAVKDSNSLQVWDGAVLVMVEPTGPDAWEENDISFRDGILAYRKNGRIKTWPDIPIAHVPGAAGVCRARGFVLEWVEARHGLYVRPEGATAGHLVSDSGKDYAPDMRLQPDGALLIVSSAGPGELPSEFQRYVVNPAEGEWVDLLAPVSQPLPSLPVLVPRRPIWRGLCGGVGPGNVLWRDASDTSQRPVIDGMPWALKAPRDGRLRWIFFSPAENRGDLYPNAEAQFVAALAHAKETGAAIIVVDDGNHGDVQPWIERVRAADLTALIGLECYPRAGETASHTLARFTANAGRTSERIAAFRAVYDGSGQWSKAEVYRLSLILDAYIELDTKIDMDLAFGYGRAGNYAVWPDFQAYWDEVCKATPTPVQPKPQPSSLELLMGALTLKRSQFKDGSFDPSRKLYPDVTNAAKHLSIDSVTGDPRPGGMPGNGPSESFIVKGDRAVVDFGTHAYTFPVTD